MISEFGVESSQGEVKLEAAQSLPAFISKIIIDGIEHEIRPPLPLTPGGFLHLKVAGKFVELQWLEI